MRALCLAASAALFMSMAWPPGAAAQAVPCDKRADVLAHLAKKYGEAPVAIGLGNTGGLVEVLTSDGGSTWTIIITSPYGEACMVAAGEGWRELERKPVGEGT